MSADIERFEAIGTDEDPRMVPTRVGPWVRFTDYEATIGRLTGECEASMDTIARERARADAAEAEVAKAREALETANTWINVNYDREPVPDSIRSLQSIILAALAPEGE